MSYQKSILTALICASSLLCYSQNKSWNLQDCIKYAEKENLNIKQAKINTELNRSELERSNFSRYPNLNGSANHNYTWGRSFDVITNAPITERVQSNSFRLNTNATLFGGFAIKNNIEQSKVNIQQAEANERSVRDDMILNIINAYYQIQFNRENLNIAKTQTENTKKQIIDTKILVEGGVLPINNLYDLQAQLASQEAQVVQAENSVSLSLLQLKQILQLPDEEYFSVNNLNIAEPDKTQTFQSPKEIFEEALSQRANIESATLNLKSAQLGEEIAKASFYPTLSIYGNLGTFYSSAQNFIISGVQELDDPIQSPNPIGFTDPTSAIGSIPVYTQISELSTFKEATFGNQLKEALQFSAGLSLSIPIFNRNESKIALANSKLNTENIRLNRDLLKTNLRQQIETAYYDVIAANKNFYASKKQVEAIKLQLDNTKTRFELGAATSTDLITAQNNYASALADLTSAKFDFAFKKEIIDFYKGKFNK